MAVEPAVAAALAVPSERVGGVDVPLFVTFDSEIDAATIRAGSEQVPFIDQETFVWGADPQHSASLSAWLSLQPQVELSYYMPYSRAPAARP